MPSRFSRDFPVVVENHSDFGTPELVSDIVTTKADTVLAVSTKDDALCLVGTYEQLLAFAAEIMRTVYSWPIITGHVDWLGDEVTFTDGKVHADATERVNARGRGQGVGGDAA